MEMIITNKEGEEVDFPSLFSDVDMEIGNGTKNDFAYTISKQDYNPEIHSVGCRLFIPGTEYGGIIQKRTVTKLNEIVLSGKTWRGLLTTKIIKPPKGQAYLSVKGEANGILTSLTAGLFGDIVRVSTGDSGIQILNYQIARYVKLLDGIEAMLASAGARLDISYNQGEPNAPGYVELKAVPVRDYSDDFEVSEDEEMSFDITEDYAGVNHLICLGRGELTERMVLDLYVQQDGTIGTKQFYFGKDLNEEVYDYPSVESEEELLRSGEKRLGELMSHTEVTPYLKSEQDIAIGDIAGGRERITGIVTKVPIMKKIITIENGNVDVEYDLKGGNQE